MAIEATIPDSQIDGTLRYATEDPVGAGAPGVIVPPAVLQVLMKTSAALSPKPSAPPPHPQVTAPLAPIPLGYQFAFNQLTSPTPYGNIITAYRIYRNKMSNSFSGAQLIRTITHDPTHQGAVTVQDSTGGNVNYFYFVTAVDSTGQESNTPGSFQASAVTSGSANPNISQGTSTSVAAITTVGTAISGASVTITAKGNPVLIIAMTVVDWISATSGKVTLNLFKDGTVINTLVSRGSGVTGDTQTLTLAFLDSPPAGSHTYDLRISAAANSIASLDGWSAIQVVELG